MANVTVWKFDSPGGAASAAARLETLAIEGAGHIVDGAAIEWAESQRKARLTPFRHRSAPRSIRPKVLALGFRRTVRRSDVHRYLRIGAGEHHRAARPGEH